MIKEVKGGVEKLSNPKCPRCKGDLSIVYEQKGKKMVPAVEGIAPKKTKVQCTAQKCDWWGFVVLEK